MKVTEPKLRVCEIFCGTKSVSKACLERNWEVTTLDNDPKFNPDILCDIMDFEYEKFLFLTFFGQGYLVLDTVWHPLKEGLT